MPAGRGEISLDFICPYCDSAIAPDDPYVLEHGRCMHCGGAITLPPDLPKPMPSRAEGADAGVTSLPYTPEEEGSPGVQARVRAELGVSDALANPVGTHYVYQEMITDFMERVATQADMLLLAIEACQQQIAIAPAVVMALHRTQPNAPLPRHAGFEGLCLLRERQHQYERVVELAETAQAQGWAGPWDRLILRCKKTTIQRRKQAE